MPMKDETTKRDLSYMMKTHGHSYIIKYFSNNCLNL